MLRVVAVLILLTGIFARPSTAASARSVTVAVDCRDGYVTARLTNRTGQPLHIAFARTLMRPVGPTVLDRELPDGQMIELKLGLEETDPSPGEGALLVTSAGVMRPTCGDGEATIDLGAPPGTAEARAVEAPAIAARTISLLESLAAYDALYALLHADAKVLTSPEQVTCWYAATPEVTTAEATVLSTAFVRWTWGGNAKTYDAAEMTIRQPYWRDGVREDRELVEHLVLDSGQWRWFLGTDPNWIAALPASCSATAAMATQVTASGPQDICTWYAETTIRLYRAAQWRQEVDQLVAAHDVFRITLRAPTVAADFDDLAIAQERSRPPTAAAEISRTISTAFGQIGQGVSLIGTVALEATRSGQELSTADPQVVRALAFIQAGDTSIAGIPPEMDQLQAQCADEQAGGPERTEGDD
jgi:hypothetical protein